MTNDLQYLSMLARRTTNSVVITDARRQITWVNEGFERVTGYTAAEVIGKTPGKLLQCEGTDPHTVACMRAALEAGQPWSGEILNRGKHGHEYWVDLGIEPMHDEQGVLTGFMDVQLDVTREKRAAAELRANRAFLEKASRIGGLGGWSLDLRTHELQWSEQTRRILEFDLPREPDLQDFLACCRPPATELLRQAVGEHAAPVLVWDLELSMVTCKGRDIWVRMVAEGADPECDDQRIFGALQDITAQRALQGEVVRQAQLLRGAMEAVGEAFVLYDPQDRLVYCNQKYRDLFRVPPDLIVPGARLEEILRQSALAGQFPQALGRVDDWVAECMHKHRNGDDTRIQQVSDGRVLRIIDRRMPDGHTVGFRVDLTDIALARNASERVNRAQTHFIATMSHELRTPLQAITGFSELGKLFAQDDARYQSMFTDIHDGGMRMLKLVNGLLDISKIDGSPDSMALKPGDLAALAAAVVHELSPLAARRALRVRLPEPLPRLAAEMDDFRIQQVIRNLLANAMRFGPEGTAIDIGCADLGAAGVELWVRDHGPGIPPDELEAIFDAFVQSSRTFDGSGGTGLGLTISRKIIQAHAGRLTAENAEGGGALFRIRVPAVAPVPTAACRPLATATAAPAPVRQQALEPT